MPKFRLLLTCAALSFAALQPATADEGMAGAYLAARHATVYSDYQVAARYYDLLIDENPADAVLLEYAILAHVALGDTDRALQLALKMDALGEASQVGNLLILSSYGVSLNYDQLLTDIDNGRVLGPLVLGLFKGWSLLGAGKMSDALDAFDAVAKMPGLGNFAYYHKALALASVGDFEGADKIFSGEAHGVLRVSRRGVIAHLQVLSQLERNAAAIELIDATFDTSLDLEMAQLRARLAAGEPVPFSVVRDARDGLAEVLHSVAGALSVENNDAYTLAYSRLAEHLRPGFSDAIILSARILEEQKQFDLATAVYNLIPHDDPAFLAAELGRADAMIKLGKVEGAVEVLQLLSKSSPDLPMVWSKLGDALRQQERYGEAAKAYDAGIALIAAPEAMHWALYYTRGIANERVKNWAGAEADFRMALKLFPDQPHVLNYLGYSYLERQTNLDEALDMIERAVAARPDDGMILDSLGWGLFRLARYDEAVPHMERAVELEPVDPIVNDHLGDVYWAVGRKREAEFQWKRALSFEPATPEEATRIRAKLETGLDAVLKAEGVPAIAISADGGN